MKQLQLTQNMMYNLLCMPTNNNIFTQSDQIFRTEPYFILILIVGYEPAGLTVQPPPKKK